MSNEANLSEKEKWLNLSQSLEKDLDRIRFELQSALTANDLLVKQLAEAENEIARLNKSLKEWELWKETL